jgi:TonB family protein
MTYLKRRCTLRRLLIMLVIVFACAPKQLREARAALDSNDLARASTLLDVAIKQKPDHAEAYVLLGELELRRHNDMAAGEAFSRALTLDKNTKPAIAHAYVTDIQRALTDAHRDDEDDRSLLHARYALELDPTQEAAFTAWVITTKREQLRRGELPFGADFASSYAREHASAREELSKAYFEAADQYERAGNLDRALYAFAVAGEWGAKRAAAARIITIAQRKPDNPRSNVNYFATALRLDPTLEQDEELYWRANHNLPRLYLERYPNGKHAAEAQQAIGALPAPTGESIITAAVTPPVIIERTTPANPGGANGIVILEVVVNTSGLVEETRVLKPLRDDADAEAQRAVRTWRFSPAMKNNQPVRGTLPVTVIFKP